MKIFVHGELCRCQLMFHFILLAYKYSFRKSKYPIMYEIIYSTRILCFRIRSLIFIPAAWNMFLENNFYYNLIIIITPRRIQMIIFGFNFHWETNGYTQFTITQLHILCIILFALVFCSSHFHIYSFTFLTTVINNNKHNVSARQMFGY